MVFGVFVYSVIMVILGLLVKFLEGLFGGSEPPSTPPPTYRPPVYQPPSYAPPQEERYTKDWPKVSRKAKEAAGWRCSECNVYCGASKQHRRLLHVHHIDLDSKNNSGWNLAVLCVECHALRPGAGHKRLRGAIDTDGRLDAVRRLRGYPMWS